MPLLIIRSVVIPDGFYSLLTQAKLVQMERQQAIYDQNLNLIVSPRNDQM